MSNSQMGSRKESIKTKKIKKERKYISNISGPQSSNIPPNGPQVYPQIKWTQKCVHIRDGLISRAPNETKHIPQPFQPIYLYDSKQNLHFVQYFLSGGKSAPWDSLYYGL